MQTLAALLSTPLGPARVTPLRRDRLHIASTHRDPGGAPLTIFRVPHSLQTWVIRQDGTWQITGDCGFYLQRIVSGLQDSTPSHAAIRAIHGTLLPVVLAWARVNPRLFDIAEAVAIAQEITRCDAAIAEAEAGLATLRTQCTALTETLAQLQQQLDLDVTEFAAAAEA